MADAFDPENSLFQEKTSEPFPIDSQLSIQEVNIQKEIKQHCREIPPTSFPCCVPPGSGMWKPKNWQSCRESVPAREEILRHRAGLRPTAESMHFVSMPTTLEWYMKHVFSLPARAVESGSSRLVTNPEKMVLRETQQAFVFFLLHGLTIDSIIVNRVLPEAVTDTWFDQWRASQAKILDEIEEYFAPVPMKRVHDP